MQKKLGGLWLAVLIISPIIAGVLPIRSVLADHGFDVRRRVHRDVRREFPNGREFRRKVDREVRRNDFGTFRRFERDVRREFPNGREVRRRVERESFRPSFGFRGFFR